MDKTFFEQPNENYVNRLMNATDKKTILATEDIYDSRGVKLWAAGNAINVSLRERLLATKLKKPIEMCVQVADGIKAADIAREVQTVLEEKPIIAKLAGDHGMKALDLFNHLTLTGLPHLQLSTAEAEGSGSYHHAVLTAAIGAFIALQLGLEEAAVSSLIMAGLAHDMGEMYVSPDLLQARRELTFDEWKGIAAHPRIGAVLLSEYGRFPAPVVRAVQEHHERLDGSGYPSGSTSEKISQLGQVLMVAEVMATILPSKENPEARALLALRLVKGQFEPSIVSLLSLVYRDHSTSIPNGFNLGELTETARIIADRLKLCDEEAAKIAAQSALPSNWQELAQQARSLCRILNMSLISTGVLSAIEGPVPEMETDPGIANELHVVITESKWRMRSLSRHVALSATRWERAMEVFDPLIQSLYIGDAAAGAAAAGSAPPIPTAAGA
jgi:HD-GYP domain-containing protein (c-di-GMP phosphodiesterase class II)